MQTLLKNDTEQKQIHWLREQTYGYQVEWVGGKDSYGVGVDMYTLLCLKWITSKNLLYNIGNSTQYYVI